MGGWLDLAARTLLRAPVDVAPQRCLRSRLAASDCRRCADICPAEAVRLEPRGVRVDALFCEGCGLCQGTCWSAAFSLRQLRLPQGADQEVHLTCSGGDEIANADVPCLGALDPGRLAEAAAGHVLHLRPRQACTDCRWGNGLQLLEANVEVARRSMTGMKIPGEIRLEQPAESSNAPNPAETLIPPAAAGNPAAAAGNPRSNTAAASDGRPLGRRELFQGVAGGVARTVAQLLPADEKDWPDVGQRLRRLADRWHAGEQQNNA